MSVNKMYIERTPESRDKINRFKNARKLITLNSVIKFILNLMMHFMVYYIPYKGQYSVKLKKNIKIKRQNRSIFVL